MMHELRTMPFQPSLDSASRLLHDYAELQRASDRMLATALELGVNPTDVRSIVATQREMLGGFLTLAAGQIDLLRVFARDERIAAAAATALRRDAPSPAMSVESDDDPTGFDSGRQL